MANFELEDNLDETIDNIVEDETRRSNQMAHAEGFFLGFVAGSCVVMFFVMAWMKWGA
jgi:hypothetical protein